MRHQAVSLKEFRDFSFIHFSFFVFPYPTRLPPKQTFSERANAKKETLVI
ncbi:hypothetical protein SD77_4459 [Bacillus badius]|uniref:Ribose 5-phosphate isomerase B n=1 Tax=Bacillus badius TaxID=1455 RepID=A0ABR5AVN2_BACBA|nr:hypothetical protein SD78_0765 [Bacillus badius]KIL78779.1 hypothetical protein SD77_4459 [Bacillus badius]